jgi:Domain of unknown function (DUF4328)
MPPVPPPPLVPPGYVAYDPSRLIGRGAERIAGLAVAIQILLVIVLVANAAAAVVTVAFRSRFADFLAGTATTSDVQSATDTIGAIGIVAGGCQIGLAACVMVWMWRMARNVRVAGRSDLRWAPGWAVAGWFCPPCVFVIPWLMLQELWKASAPTTGMATWRDEPSNPLIVVWWVLYGLGGLVVAGVQFAGLGASGDLGDLAEFYERAVLWTVASTFVTVAAGACFVVLVRQLTARQRLLTGE